jgi:hypothetical protein
MMKLSSVRRDWIGSALLLVVALATMYISVDYELGTPRSMGPGFFPFVLGAVLVILSVTTFAESFYSSRDETATVSFYAPLLVLASMAAFALLMFTGGLIAAILVSVLVSSFSSKEFNLFSSLVLGGVLSACSVLIFKVLLDQPLPLLGSWFVN